MSKILDRLYLGGAMDANNRKLLDELKVTHILIVAKELPAFQTQSFTYLKIDAKDNLNYDLSAHFAEMNKFIDVGRAQGGVLVHCMFGVSRSATAVLAYLIYKEKISYSKALAIVKQKRPIAPNDNFVKQLMRYSGERAHKRKTKDARNCLPGDSKVKGVKPPLGLSNCYPQKRSQCLSPTLGYLFDSSKKRREAKVVEGSFNALSKPRLNLLDSRRPPSKLQSAFSQINDKPPIANAPQARLCGAALGGKAPAPIDARPEARRYQSLNKDVPSQDANDCYYNQEQTRASLNERRECLSVLVPRKKLLNFQAASLVRENFYSQRKLSMSALEPILKFGSNDPRVQLKLKSSDLKAEACGTVYQQIERKIQNKSKRPSHFFQGSRDNHVSPSISRLKHLREISGPAKSDVQCASSNINKADKDWEGSMPKVEQLRCSTCHLLLFIGSKLANHSKRVPGKEQCKYLFFESLSFLKLDHHPTVMPVLCPGCAVELGQFRFNGLICSCGVYVQKAARIYKAILTDI